MGQNSAGQRREIQKWLKGNGITDVRFYVDHETGDNLERPDFERLQKDVFMGEKVTLNRNDDRRAPGRRPWFVFPGGRLATS